MCRPGSSSCVFFSVVVSGRERASSERRRGGGWLELAVINEKDGVTVHALFDTCDTCVVSQ